MNNDLRALQVAAQGARKARDWPALHAIATQILKQDPDSAEGHFHLGLVERARNRPREATKAFEKALAMDEKRYDAAVELANQYSYARRNGDAAALLERYEQALTNSPRYLDMAGAVYTDIGLSDKAWPLFKRANELQPNIEIFKANLATCAVFLGKIEEARSLYQSLLERAPNHRQNHYQLSRLQKASDRRHIDQMKEIIRVNQDPPERAIPLYFAIAKELEDLEQWDESFEYYKKAGDAVSNVADYDVGTDLRLIDTIIETCDANWIASTENHATPDSHAPNPIFIVGLPRTGTTLTERIVSSHSKVASLGETLFLPMVLRQESGIESRERMTPEMIRAVADVDASRIAARYLECVDYRLGAEPHFIDKLPMNFLHLGFIARSWPEARIVHLVRNPMDACFSMFKQVFTWAYKFSYSMDDLARYYVAYDRLRKHWQSLLGDRLVEVQYESLVTDQEGETRRLLDRLGLAFEPACLDFEKNTAPSATASSVQIRSKIHTGSIGRWKQFEKQLDSLREHLVKAGIPVE